MSSNGTWFDNLLNLLWI